MTTPATAPVSTHAGQPSGDAAPVTPPAAPVSAASGSAPVEPKVEAKKPATSILGDDPKAEKPKVEAKADEKPKGDAPAEIEIKLPEGIKADDAALGEFKKLATDHKLSSEQASALAAWEIQRQAKAEQAQMDSWEKQGDVWAKELETEYGDKLPSVVVNAQKAIDRFGGEAVREASRRLGIGNHPAFVKAWAAVGEAISEDRANAGGGAVPPAPKVKTRAEVSQDFYSKPS